MNDWVRYIKGELKVLRGVLNKETREKAFTQLNKLDREKSDSGLQIANPIEWKRSYRTFLLAQPTEYEVVSAFYEYSPSVIREVSFDAGKPILIVLEKNENYRMKKLLDHYRKLGVEQFAVIDNDSTDGTIDYLLGQEDVSLFSIKTQYTTNRREAWINRIIAYYGYNRWYIIIDSDELLAYVGVEEHGISEVIQYAECNNIKRVRGMLVDMYPQKMDLNSKEIGNDTYDYYTYFDSDTYSEEKGTMFEVVRGGFRKRVFDSNALLTKYPLVYFEKGDIQGKSHFEFPYRYNLNTPCLIGLCHYKFLSSDVKKIRENAIAGNYFGGSVQYKKYIEAIDANNGVIYPGYAGTVKYTNSSDLLKTGIIKEIKWN